MKVLKWLAIAGAVVTVGGAVFIFSRPAAAKAAGAKAFRVSADCTSIEIVDEEAAKSALIAAGTIAFKGESQSAMELIVLGLGYAIPQCPINDYVKISGIPGVPIGITIGEIRSIVGDKTVAELMELAAQGGLPGVPGMVGASPEAVIGTDGSVQQLAPRNPVNAILAFVTGGDYP